MLPLSARSDRPTGAQNAPGQGRLLIIGMAISLVSASLGYAANGSPAVASNASVQGGGTNTSATTGGDLGGGDAAGSSGGQGVGTTGTGGVGTSGGSTGGTGGTGSTGGSTGTGTGTGGTGGAGSASTGGTGQGSSCPGGKLTCGGTLGNSDVGVTAKTIKLGFLTPSTSQLAAAGLNVGISGDQPAAVSAWANEINRLGVNGRKVSVVTQSFDVTDAQNQQAACKTLTQDQKVFSVLTPGGYDSVAQLCISKENKTPLISTDPEPAEWYQDASPNLWSTFMDKDRIMLNNAQWLPKGGYLKSTDKVGLIYHDIPTIAPSVEKTYLPALKRNGINPLVVKLAADNNAGLNQVTNAVSTFKKAGVTFVIPVMNLVYKAQFQKQATSQSYQPKYDESDIYFGCSEFTTTSYDTAGQFNHTQCLTTTDNQQYIKTLAKPTAWTAYADAVYNRTNSGGYAATGSSQADHDNQRLLNYSIGTLFMLWYHAADRAGTQLTRPVWGRGMEQTGTVTQQLGYCSMSFGPGKHDGSDGLSVSEYFHEASDGYPADRYHTIKPCFTKYF